ncbi:MULTISPECIES: transglycosylase SLT domain-containing protein [unclassified Mucilaginibacter]|uniref:lytic transglycosylase domain-containing protein n=1 Tax=unclassified Mucilaginibacter TaxID=2617802 RepID=UPI002AC8AA1A|nr:MULTISPECIES: transglycosylase SLT domain-containing protein [unclassified Mucilaginibacter]MEB0260471.1 transglycosylase SLT domain-containing protein [Mucilaginibacter sp. 10I4]MEB0280053.1 transglycosylase SLT domain-containing protein [Mucilaginibacter sp. 10B2]MEB0302566.1 transglycosylase SLT domain-containing protein [Mucilaginibacter sp. 5C4]WPX23605.1 transglycosylase SLT domain-containing protein [Mucilaginibacter sp. 5C4]
MKRLFTFIICALFLQVVKANIKTEFAIEAEMVQQDTNVLLTVIQAPVYIYKNNIIKRRLDTIQKEVSLDYNGYVQAYIDNYVRRKDEMGRMIGLSKYYFPIYEKAFQDAGIPDEIKYLSIVESALNPNAISRVGAAGPWQFMSETAKIYGLAMTDYVDDRRDPVRASNAAAEYLKDAYQQFGDWLLAIASYNCGKSNVEHALEKTGTHDYWSIRELLPPETRGYVPAFIAINYVMKYHKYHHIVLQTSDLAIITDTVMVNKFVSLSRVAQALGMTLKDICTLNPSYRQQLVNGTAAIPRKIVIPVVNEERLSILRDAIADLSAPTRTPKPIQYVAIPTPVQASAAATTNTVNGVAPAIYITKKGDTLANIATKYNVKIGDLLQWNKTLGTNTTLPLLPGLAVNIGRG